MGLVERLLRHGHSKGAVGERTAVGYGDLCGKVQVLTGCLSLLCVCFVSCVLGIDRLKGEFHHSASKAADVNEVALPLQIYHQPSFFIPFLSIPCLSIPFLPIPARGFDGSSHPSALSFLCCVQVFGGKDGRFRLDWLLPRPAHFPASIVADLLGYTIQVQDSQRDIPTCIYLSYVE